jgi:hypothetical protein
MGKKALSCFGRRYPIAASPYKDDAKLLLESAHGLTHAGLANAEGPGRRGKAATVHDRDEPLQLCECDSSIPSIRYKLFHFDL